LLLPVLIAASIAAAPEPVVPVARSEVHERAKTVLMSFDRRELTEVIQFVSQFTQRRSHFRRVGVCDGIDPAAR
jgi:NADH:ubiquinone oxidoreductase subunit E